MLKTVLFTHDDLDGAGCRILFTLAHSHLTLDTDYIIINTSNAGIDASVKAILGLNLLIDHNTVICFADIMPSKEVLEKVCEKYNVQGWDHHLTNSFAMELPAGITIAAEDEFGHLESGTSLMYKYYTGLGCVDPRDPHAFFFHGGNGKPQLLADFVDTVRSYDTYEWKKTDNINAKKLQVLFTLLGMDKFCERYVYRIKDHSTSLDIIENGDNDFVQAKIDAEQKVIDRYTRDMVDDLEINGYKVAFCYGIVGANVSELAYQFLNKYPQYDIFATFYVANGGEFSFRTIRDDIDLGKEIAIPLGGGGHPKAAGAPITRDMADCIHELLIRRLYQAAEGHSIME